MTNSHEPPKLRFFGLGKLISFLKPYKMSFLWMLLAALGGGLVDILLPLFQSYAINHFVDGGTLQGILVFAAAYFVTMLAQIVANTAAIYMGSRIEAMTARDMRRAAFNHLQTLSFSYFSQNSVGYIHARVMSDTSKIGSVVTWNLLDSLWMGTYLIGATVVMLSINWKLALCVLIIIPLVGLSSIYFQKKLITLNRQVREANSKITSRFNEGITGVRTTKVLAVEGRMNRSFQDTTGDMRKKSVHTAHYKGLFNAVINFAGWLAVASVLWRGGVISVRGLMTVGTLSMFMTYAQGMMGPVQWMVQTLSDLITVKVNIERFTTLMNTQSDVTDSPAVEEAYGDTFHPKKENWEPMVGDVEFRDVSFKYPDGTDYVIEHFSLKVPAGTTVALVGETGAGKSTLVNLVCRFFEPTSGQVLIDGRDARERSQLWLHSNLGYVLQTPHLFSGTVLENLRYGNPDATLDQVREAVRLVHAEDVIARMDKGYDSAVGEGGDLLSTGEKQLLSFARAVLADPRLFVLDEATSSIDTVTEQYIQDATAKLMAGRTSFVVAHRLSTIRSADIILVVEDGRITERGSHRELMAARGAYYSLYTRQFCQEAVETAASAG